jgi:arylsulfatase A-like enzyme
MKRILNYIISLIFLISVISCKKTGQERIEKPNIILIMADDMGYSDLNCFGSEIRTPNLDRLAKEGLRMTQFYNAGRCCPTRASLLTGLYQHQAGIGDMINNSGIPAYQGYLNDNCATLAEVLKLNGYNTYMSGKWHVGGDEQHWPRKRGFDRYFGLIDGATNYFKPVPYRYNQDAPRLALDDQPFYPADSGFYITDAFTEYAIKFLDEQHSKKGPFFLYLAFTAPHWPLHALPEDIARYRGKYIIGWDSLRVQRYSKMIKSGIIDPAWALSPRHDPEVPAWSTLEDKEKEMWDLRMAVYAAMIDRMDQGIGKVLAKLKEIGESDNTLIIFISDNGGCHERIKNQGNYIRTTGITGNPDSFDSYEYNWANASNTPFRWFKHWVHEGGISAPCIVWFPEMIESGRIDPRPAHIIDIMPTLVELAGGIYPDSLKGNPVKPMMGQSLVPVFKNINIKWERTLLWEHEGNRALRKGDWKLVSRYDQNAGGFTPWELYNLNKDRSELNDLSSALPEKTKEMIDLYEKMAAEAEVTPWDEVLRIRQLNRR